MLEPRPSPHHSAIIHGSAANLSGLTAQHGQADPETDYIE